MRLVNSTTAWLKRFVVLSTALFFYSLANAQENSPYSRFGMGDFVPNQNIMYRGMGGVSIADNNVFTLNFKNPASLGGVKSNVTYTNTVFDVGGEIDIRTLRNTNSNTTSSSKYTSTNTIFSYLQIGFPIASSKMEKKGMGWGLSFGLRPVSKINYKIEKNERLSGIDSLNTLYEGSGGINQLNISSGFSYKNFKIGVSTGYTFGNRDYSTQLIFMNDTVVYLKSNSQAQAHFGGIFLNTGVQYKFNFESKSSLSVGAYANLQQKLKAKEDHVDETFSFDGNGGITAIDTIRSGKDIAGDVKLPGTYGIGFNYQDSAGRWKVGADFELSNWDSYRYYGNKDSVKNSWTLRVGAEFLPATYKTGGSKYFSFVRYRAGFYIGPDYINLNDTRINYAASIGASFPLTSTSLLRSYGNENQYVVLHTSIEYGGRGNKESSSFRENTLRFGIGISMNARWFRKRSYY